jgi:DNA polymerase-3 subunit epsilon
LLNTLVKPKRRWIPKEAQAIHGITNAMVAEAPKWQDVHEQVIKILDQCDGRF